MYNRITIEELVGSCQGTVILQFHSDEMPTTSTGVTLSKKDLDLLRDAITSYTCRASHTFRTEVKRDGCPPKSELEEGSLAWYFQRRITELEKRIFDIERSHTCPRCGMVFK
jgi:hypothetical protein